MFIYENCEIVKNMSYGNYYLEMSIVDWFDDDYNYKYVKNIFNALLKCVQSCQRLIFQVLIGIKCSNVILLMFSLAMSNEKLRWTCKLHSLFWWH